MGALDQSECLSLTSLLESRGILGLKKAKDVRLTKVPPYTFLVHEDTEGKVTAIILVLLGGDAGLQLLLLMHKIPT